MVLPTSENRRLVECRVLGSTARRTRDRRADCPSSVACSMPGSVRVSRSAFESSTGSDYGSERDRPAIGCAGMGRRAPATHRLNLGKLPGDSPRLSNREWQA